jgi:hypothetical protein
MLEVCRKFTVLQVLIYLVLKIFPPSPVHNYNFCTTMRYLHVPPYQFGDMVMNMRIFNTFPYTMQVYKKNQVYYNL